MERENERMPRWLVIVLGAALLWNVFGIYQFLDSLRSTQDSLMAMGLSEAQAAKMQGLPLWMKVAFALGTFGGTLGCVLMLLKLSVARLVFAASLAGYLVLYIGDITEGVFAALGVQQVMILTTVVLIAAGLLALAFYSQKQNFVR